jgi:hypothetical protein
MSNPTARKQVQLRREQWREMIRKQAHSGLSIRAFCAQHGIRDTVFYAWCRQLRTAEPMRFALAETGAVLQMRPRRGGDAGRPAGRFRVSSQHAEGVGVLRKNSVQVHRRVKSRS